MAKRKKSIPEYGTTTIRGNMYYRTRILDADEKYVSLYAKTPEELYDKVLEAKQQIKDAKFRRAHPTVKEYCEKWLLMKSANLRVTTLKDYTSKVKNYIIAPLGHRYMSDITADDVKIAILPASKKSESIYHSVQMLYKSIFESAEESIIVKCSSNNKLCLVAHLVFHQQQSFLDIATYISLTKSHQNEVTIQVFLLSDLS